MMNIEAWKNHAENNSFKFLMVVKDLEDRDFYPVYFSTQEEMKRYEKNIISESKVKIIAIINVE